MRNADTIALEIISLLEEARQKLETLRAGAINTAGGSNGWNARALSVALTELETSQLWIANARPDPEI